MVLPAVMQTNQATAVITGIRLAQFAVDLVNPDDLRSRLIDLEAFAQAHAERAAILSPGEVGAQIHVILAAQHIARPNPHAGKDVLRIELRKLRRNFTHAPEYSNAQAPGKYASVFRLCGEHLPVDVTARRIPAQFILHPEDALAEERCGAAR